MKKRRKPRPRKNPLPKGSYRMPEGGIAGRSTSKVYAKNGKTRQITVRAVRRENPDLGALARLLVQMARDEQAAKHDQARSASRH